MTSDVRSAVPEKRQGRAGAGRKPSPNPFNSEGRNIADIIARTQVVDGVELPAAGEFFVKLTDDEALIGSRLRHAYYRRELTKAAKAWAKANYGGAHNWPTLALRFDQSRRKGRGRNEFQVLYWHERRPNGEWRYSG